MISLNDKVVVVTGGKGLLGAKFVEVLKQAQATVIIADINADNNAADEMQCDITSSESVKELVRNVVQKFGKLDGWVNNAYPRTADFGRMDFEEEPIESWRKNIDMHLVGYMNCCQAALNQMKSQKSGSLINISSIYGLVGYTHSIYEGTPMKTSATYAAIKGGINNLTRNLAAYYGPYNVRVNTISPGGIFDNQNPIFVENYEKLTPLKRMGKPDDIAPSVAFLLSDGASYITGHNLMIDGGWTVV